jgi:hypothetical protein
VVTDKQNSDQNKLFDIYGALQTRLQAGLNASRDVLGHPVAKGDATESNWLSMLQEHLPARYQAQSAFVIDSTGQESEQIDIVIYDRQYTPELYNSDGQRVIPAESVYAVLEVKQSLDKGNVEYAGQKAASVRALHRTSVDITHAGGKHLPIEPKHILGGILTTTSGWNPAFGDPFVASLQECADLETIDIGCCTDAGGFVVGNHNGDGAIEHSPPELALAFFFLRLLQELQQIGTVPAMDYSAYLEAMGV